MAKKRRYTSKQLAQYDDAFLWCRSFGHAWEFVNDKLGRKGQTLTIYEVVECLHCGMRRHDWREGTELARRRYETPDGYYISSGSGRSAHETFQGERIARKVRKKIKSRNRRKAA